VDPADCVAVEDSPNGLLSAKAAGMRCLAIPEPALRDDPRFEMADAVLSGLGEIGEALG
jgi:sugar-phosphatase